MRAQIRRRASKRGEDFQEAAYDFLGLLRSLQSSYGRLDEFLKEADRANGANAPDLTTELICVVFWAFRLGQECPPESITAKATAARKKRKGTPPKWATFVDDLLENMLGLPRSADGKANKIRPHLVEKLKEREIETRQRIKPPSVRTLRGYIATNKKAGKQRA
jgi:hypothetical protein